MTGEGYLELIKKVSTYSKIGIRTLGGLGCVSSRRQGTHSKFHQSFWIVKGEVDAGQWRIEYDIACKWKVGSNARDPAPF